MWNGIGAQYVVYVQVCGSVCLCGEICLDYMSKTNLNETKNRQTQENKPYNFIYTIQNLPPLLWVTDEIPMYMHTCFNQLGESLCDPSILPISMGGVAKKFLQRESEY